MKKHHDGKLVGEERAYLAYTFVTVCHRRKSAQALKQGRSMEAGAAGEAMEGTAS